MKILPALIAITSIFTAVTVQAGTWTALTNQPTFLNPSSLCQTYPNADCSPGGYSFGGILNANLLTDGSVLVEADAYDNYFDVSYVEYKLTPDIFGSYANGTWSQVASLPNAASAANPNGWGPYAFASAVLPDGRVIYEGGEYSGAYFSFALANQGAIYDPVQNTWTPVLPPPFFENLYPADPPDLPGYNSDNPYPRYPGPFTSNLVNAIGDSQSVVLPDGTFMLASKLSRQQALLDAKTLTWTPTGTGKADVNSEEGWTLLPNGKVLTIDCDLDYWYGLTPDYAPGNSELYDPETGSWSSAGNTVNVLTSFPEGEIGPAVLMANGIVFAEGDNGTSALYDSYDDKWSAGPTLPTISVNGQIQQLEAGDTGAALLPNGNVLVSATATADELPPTEFFEFDGRRFIPEPGTPNSPLIATVDMLVLPTGQILEFDTTSDIELYTPSDDDNRSRYAPVPLRYAPVSLEVPSVVSPGTSYRLSGVHLNGVSQGAMEGDDYQSATNYPLVRITNLQTHHVFYSRTHDFSSMAVANPYPVTASFDVPADQELGPSLLEVVTNGVPSEPVPVLVRPTPHERCAEDLKRDQHVGVADRCREGRYQSKQSSRDDVDPDSAVRADLGDITHR